MKRPDPPPPVPFPDTDDRWLLTAATVLSAVLAVGVLIAWLMPYSIDRSDGICLCPCPGVEDSDE